MIYNVVLNSLNKESSSISTCNATYIFDWGVLPDKKFKMRYNFVSSNIDATNIKIALLSLDLGQTMYKNSSLKVQGQNTLNVGVLIPYNVTSKSYLYADRNTNQPITMNRPRNNQFRVEITTNDVVPISWSDSTSAIPLSYVLILSFEEI
jgi:hypothetical protein